MDFQEISSWALTAVVSLDSVRDQWAVYLGFVSIHRLSLLAPPAQYARLIPATEIQHIPHQLPAVLTCSQHTAAITVGVDYLPRPKKPADMYLHYKYSALQSQINHLPLDCKSQSLLFLHNMRPINIAAIVLVCRQWRSTVQCAIKGVCPEVGEAYPIFMIYSHHQTPSRPNHRKWVSQSAAKCTTLVQTSELQLL